MKYFGILFVYVCFKSRFLLNLYFLEFYLSHPELEHIVIYDLNTLLIISY